MCALSEASRHVARPVAHISQAPTFAVIIPLYAHGSMDFVLHNPKYTALDWKLRLLFCLDVTSAVAFCHERNVIIRDIKPANMLVDARYHAALADLELAKTEDEVSNPKEIAYSGPSSRRKTRFEGTPEYMAPELLKAPGSALQRGKAPITKSTDVYSVGITLVEIATSRVPYTDVERTTEQLHTVVETRYSPSALHEAIVAEHLRPTPIAECADLQSLVDACWQADPGARPEMAAVHEKVRGILRQATPAGFSAESADRARLVVVTGGEKTAGAGEGEELRRRRGVLLREGAGMRDWKCVLRQLAGAPPDGRFGVPPACVAGGGEGTAGRRDFMEDDWFSTVWVDERSGARLFGVLDGHGGVACARYVKAHLPGAIEQEVLSLDRSDATPAIPEALIRAFSAVQQSWENFPDCDASGACCTVALIVETQVYIAWCGDCSAVACRSGTAHLLTKDHVPSRDTEAARIAACGGRIVETADGKKRVGGKVAVSRSFGDNAHKAVITAAPEIVQYPIRGADEFLVLASDGVWDVMSPQRVVDGLKDTVRHPDYGAKRVACDAFNC
eukprot:gene12836-19782_t